VFSDNAAAEGIVPLQLNYFEQVSRKLGASATLKKPLHQRASRSRRWLMTGESVVCSTNENNMVRASVSDRLADETTARRE